MGLEPGTTKLRTLNQITVDLFFFFLSWREYLFFNFLLRGRRQIAFVTLRIILTAKVLTPIPPFTRIGLHLMVFNHGALKTYAEKLLVHVTFDILAISLKLVVH